MERPHNSKSGGIDCYKCKAFDFEIKSGITAVINGFVQDKLVYNIAKLVFSSKISSNLFFYKYLFSECCGLCEGIYLLCLASCLQQDSESQYCERFHGLLILL